MTDFELFIGIDYSGAATPTSRLPGLQVFAAAAGGEGCEKWSSPTKSNNGRPVNWTRREIAERLLAEAQSGRRFLAGIDHCFSFPASYFKRYGLKTWPAFLDDFVHHWPTHGDHVYVDFVRDGVMQRDHGLPPPGQRVGKASELRLCERWTSSAKSVFKFDVQGSVAKSSHAGIPWLKWLCDDRSPDEQDAYATARWMADMASRGALAACFDPPLAPAERALAALEGWILGVR